MKKSEHYQSESKTVKRSQKQALKSCKFHAEWQFLCFLVLNCKHFEVPLCFDGTFSSGLKYKYVKEIYFYVTFLTKKFVLSTIIRIFATSVPTKPLNDAQMRGAFLYMHVHSQNTLMERLPHFMKHYMSETDFTEQ